MVDKKPKVVLFDWDNTLVDTNEAINVATNEVMRAMGMKEMSLAETKFGIHRSLYDSFPEIFGDKWKEAAKLYIDSYRRVAHNLIKPTQHAEELLGVMRDLKDVQLAVVSNKTGELLRNEIKKFGWEEIFPVAVGARDAKRDKPHPDPALLALRLLDAGDPGHHIWFIGDTVTDMECAHNTGCLPILYGETDPEHEIFGEHKPHHHFPGFDKLIEKIRKF